MGGRRQHHTEIFSDFQQPPLQGLVWPTFIHLRPDSGTSHPMGREFWCSAGQLGQKPPDPHHKGV